MSLLISLQRNNYSKETIITNGLFVMALDIISRTKCVVINYKYNLLKSFIPI